MLLGLGNFEVFVFISKNNYVTQKKFLGGFYVSDSIMIISKRFP
jgi:hypothetical protein